MSDVAGNTQLSIKMKHGYSNVIKLVNCEKQLVYKTIFSRSLNYTRFFRGLHSVLYIPLNTKLYFAKIITTAAGISPTQCDVSESKTSARQDARKLHPTKHYR